ncbi:MAG: hypothetical protein J5766_01150 [Clostridia bacterium]|nr:hypothetical protein [Clostridia bacterium]
MSKDIERTRDKLLRYRVFGTKMDRFHEMGLMFPKEKKSYDDKAKKCRVLMKNIENAIAEVDDGILSEILFQKYVLGRSLETISYAVNYSKRQIERLHLCALEKVDI